MPAYQHGLSLKVFKKHIMCHRIDIILRLFLDDSIFYNFFNTSDSLNYKEKIIFHTLLRCYGNSNIKLPVYNSL